MLFSSTIYFPKEKILNITLILGNLLPLNLEMPPWHWILSKNILSRRNYSILLPNFFFPHFNNSWVDFYFLLLLLLLLLIHIFIYLPWLSSLVHDFIYRILPRFFHFKHTLKERKGKQSTEGWDYILWPFLDNLHRKY